MSDNKQVEFWRGSFGNDYIARNQGDTSGAEPRKILWSNILSSVSEGPQTILEVGANIGLNLIALSEMTDAKLFAVEPNHEAREALAQSGVVPPECLFDGTADSLPLKDASVEMAFTCGVLIHISPEHLLASCREIERVSSRYIACAEYFSVEPEEVSYRGHDGFLFKRDYGAFWMDNFPNLKLVDYGFLWKRATGLDDLTWWLFEKGSV